jgi:C4-dicarboxylate transporter DctM subunit
VSIGEMFVAGILPGILMGILVGLVAWRISVVRGYDTAGSSFSAQRMWKALKSSIWGLLAPVVIVGGIYWGVFTPTEAAGVAVIYSLVIGLFIYQSIDLRSLTELARTTAVDTSVVMLIIACSSLFAWVIAIDGTVVAAVREMATLMNSQWQVFLLAAVVLLIAGLFVDGASIYLVIIPLLMPAVNAQAIDLIWFGIFAALAIGIGQFTPPVGVNLFVAARVLNIRFDAILTEILPFLLVSVVGLLLIYLFPAVSTWLPSTMR